MESGQCLAGLQVVIHSPWSHEVHTFTILTLPYCLHHEVHTFTILTLPYCLHHEVHTFTILTLPYCLHHEVHTFTILTLPYCLHHEVHTFTILTLPYCLHLCFLTTAPLMELPIISNLHTLRVLVVKLCSVGHGPRIPIFTFVF
jgi:hypothetical protein